jgi:hypothetical protein
MRLRMHEIAQMRIRYGNRRVCNGPPKSSHELELSRAEFSPAAIAEQLVRPSGVIPFDPLTDSGARFGEIAEVMLPDRLFLETLQTSPGTDIA